jgi:hypothetical protein
MISVYDMTTGDWRSQAEPAQAPQPAREHATDLDLRLMTIDEAASLQPRPTMPHDLVTVSAATFVARQ